MRYIDNPDLFTSEEMKSNVYAAANDARMATRIATRIAANAAFYTANAANAAYDTYDAIDWYFKRTGEDKESYNNEVERLR